MCFCLPSEASMQVSPTQIYVAAEARAAGLTLLNNSEQAIYAQIRVFEWQQQDGEDQLLPSRAIVASPPMLKLQPGVDQLVRIVRNGLPPDSQESSYRIIIDEMPIAAVSTSTAAETADEALPGGLQFRLRYSIPVFLAPPKQIEIQPVLHTRLIEEADAMWIAIGNEGRAHAQIVDLIWQQGEQRINIVPGLAGYVLPGQQRQWRLPDGLNLSHGGVFTARINGELLERILVPITAAD